VNESLEDLINYEEDRNRSARVRRSECPGGSGKFGFNSYNLLAFLLMSFNQVRISVYRFNVFGLFVLNISIYICFMCPWKPIKDKNESEDIKNKNNLFSQISMFKNSFFKNILSTNSSSGKILSKNSVFENILSKNSSFGNILSRNILSKKACPEISCLIKLVRIYLVQKITCLEI